MEEIEVYKREEALLEVEKALVSDRTQLTPKQEKILVNAVAYDHDTSRFKIRHFMGDAQITPYQKFKQFLLEMRTREEVIENLLANIVSQQAKIEMTQAQLDNAMNPAQLKMYEFQLVADKNDLIKINRRLKMAYAERKKFIEEIEFMYETGEAYLSNGMDMLEAINTPEIDEQLEMEHWVYRLGKQAALDIIVYGKIQTGNLEAITMMNEKAQVECLKVATNWAVKVDDALGELHSQALKQLGSGQPVSLNIFNSEPVSSDIAIMSARELKELE